MAEVSPLRRVGDLISISPAPAVVSLGQMPVGQEPAPALALLSGYSLAEAETRAAFEAITRSLARREERGDAFLISGVYGSGKSHLLAALALLAGHPKEAWPALLASYPGYDRISAAFDRPRLVVAIPLDEYPSASHSLEHIVLSRLEAELAGRHGAVVALTEQSHLLDLVERYVVPQVGDRLNEAASASAGESWPSLRQRDPEQAAEVALRFLADSGFPLDWRRSRAEAWGALRRALEAGGVDGALVLLDELGTFLAGKDRQGLNADAAFLQYVAQRTSGERSWLVCVTQRGLEEVGDIDRRTLRQLRDRFRPSFTLSLAELGWVVQHRLAPRRDPAGFRAAMAQVHAGLSRGEHDLGFTVDELARSYPLNPLCLDALQRAAEMCLSQTRSAVRLLQEAARERQWLERPAAHLVTPDLVFDVFRDEMAQSIAGRKHLHACEVVMANAERIAPGRERQVAVVTKALCVLGIAELRWSLRELRASLVGCEDEELWRNTEMLEVLLGALYRRGAYVERARREGEEADEYYLDVTSEASERIRQRMNELVRELTPGDSRVARAALEACRADAFPLAGLMEPRSLPVEWHHARRQVMVVSRDLSGLAAGELQNLAGSLEAPESKEDGWLFIALPTSDSPSQGRPWKEIAGQVKTRFAGALLAWLPRELGGAERDHLVEHAALSLMVSDPTVARPRERELRAKLRQRWEDSEAEVRRMLQRAYYQGRIVTAAGEPAVAPERLAGLAGRWEETLTTAFADAVRKLFPHFPSVAPERRLAGRAQTNQIIDQFIRPGQVALPPASALEAHLAAYAAPLGLVEGRERQYQLALTRRDLVAATLEATPPRGAGDEVEPGETISYAQLAGRLAKSQWGITREQSELLIAALVRTGHLIALDAFLRPVRLDVTAAPLGDNLPYLMRGTALVGPTARAARSLWASTTGGSLAEWDLPAQERAWADLLRWAAALLSRREQTRAALGRVVAAFTHADEEWAWAREALARAEALAAGLDSSLTSRAGLARLVAAAESAEGGPGGVVAAEMLSTWRCCQHFLDEEADGLARLGGLAADERVQCPQGSLLERERRVLLAEFASSARLVKHTREVRAAAARWLEAYRRHYLGWHASVHALARFAGLIELRQSAPLEAARRLARAGLAADRVSRVEAELERGLAQRCQTGDPLPAGSPVCPTCGLRLGQEVPLPAAAVVAAEIEVALAEQRKELTAQEDLIRRRLTGCGDTQVAAAVSRLLAYAAEGSAEEVRQALGEEVIAWLRQQLAQPKAARREWRELETRLRGKEMGKGEVRRQVEEWLGEGEEVVEIE